MNEFESYLQKRVDENQPGRVKEAMHYSLMNGGKRIRPRLLFGTLDLYGIDEKKGYPAASAIEMVHTYSLIHDDLPAMDDDDLRRGSPSCHKAFDEATAILAGDGLLTKAFDVILDTDIPSSRIKTMVHYLSDYAGVDGMVYGQELDLKAEINKDLTVDEIYAIDEYKTAKLLTLPFLFGSIIANREEDMPTFIQMGYALGIQFQIQDDILDVTKTSAELGKSTSDEKNHKQTIVSLYGLEKAKQIVADKNKEINDLLSSLNGNKASLEKIIAYLTKRTY